MFVKTLYILDRIRAYPPRKILRRGISLLIKRGRRLAERAARRFRILTDNAVFQNNAAPGHDLNDPAQLLEYFRGQRAVRGIPSADTHTDLLQEEHLPAVSRQLILSQADRSTKHIFDLLGAHDVSLGRTIDWHRDFRSGYRWDAGTSCESILIPYGKADIKVPWELSRCQHFAALGQAYRLTKDEKYAREFMEQVTSWITSNPEGLGVNWTCAMDVAIRAANWTLGYRYFQDSPELTAEFLALFLNSLSQHGRHVRSNLGDSELLTNNHYLAELAGLMCIGTSFPELKGAADWTDLATRELAKEMEKQVYADGCHFEASTCYHCLALECFFYATLLRVVNDKAFQGDFAQTAAQIFGEPYTQRLYRMFEAVLYLLKPNGRIPQIGDNDNGHFLILHRRENLDFRYLLTLGAVFFNEPRFKVEEFGWYEEALWVFGVNGRARWDGLPPTNLEGIPSRAFENSGWYILRDNLEYAIICCGPNGQNGNGGHGHNDKLSFELFSGGRDLLVDPGTFVYTADPKERNRFRSTRSHNTVRINGEEQNRIREGNLCLFQLGNDVSPRCLAWRDRDGLTFVGEYRTAGKARPVTHQREIHFDKARREWEIIDRFSGEGQVSLEWNFVLAPGAQGKVRVHSPTIELKENPWPYSPCYGETVPTTQLTGQREAGLPTEFRFSISTS